MGIGDSPVEDFQLTGLGAMLQSEGVAQGIEILGAIVRTG
jgi:hypothetical protein